MAENGRAEEQPQKHPQNRAAAGPAQTRFFFKLLGLVLIAIAIWLASFYYRTGDCLT